MNNFYGVFFDLLEALQFKHYMWLLYEFLLSVEFS
jgi:hypothetical protein